MLPCSLPLGEQKHATTLHTVMENICSQIVTLTSLIPMYMYHISTSANICDSSYQQRA